MLKIETHCHTFGGSICADCPADITVKKYKDAGYNGVVITNHLSDFHFRSYPGNTDRERLDYYFNLYDVMQKKFNSVGIKTFLGTEVAVKNDQNKNIEFILLGFDRDLIYDNKLIYNLSIKELFEFSEKHNLFMYQSHPFRDNVILSNPEYMHGAEAFNGHFHHYNHNDKAEAFCEKNNLIKMSGTDFHHENQPITAGMFIDDEIDNEKALAEFFLNNKGKMLKNVELYEKKLKEVKQCK